MGVNDLDLDHRHVLTLCHILGSKLHRDVLISGGVPQVLIREGVGTAAPGSTGSASMPALYVYAALHNILAL
jgi:hypothetical protein